MASDAVTALDRVRAAAPALSVSILAGDMNAVLACVLIIGGIFVALNLLSDLLYRTLDPRTK